MILLELQHLATPIEQLKPLPGNPRKGDVEAVAKSYERFGQRKPIVVTEDGTVIAGNHQLLAAKKLGWTEIAVVRVEDDEQTAKAFALADNRTADLGSYDDTLLAELLADVSSDLDLLAATGYTEQDLDDLIASIEPEQVPIAESDAIPDKAPAKTIRGDVWLLGPHRLLCGDCREPTDVEKLLAGAIINLAFTSPPYAEQRTYDESSGFKPIPPDEYVAWFEMVQTNVAANLAQDGSWFVNIKPASEGLDTQLYVFDLVIAHVRQWGWHFATEFCWERVGIPGKPQTRFKNQHEPIYQFARDKWKIRPNAVMIASHAAFSYEAGKGKSLLGNQGNVNEEWFAGRASDGMAYPGNRLPTFAGSHEALGHGAAFPVGLPEFFVKAYTDEGDTVFDPFMGSGSTLLAAHNQKRIAYGTEISPAYCDIICARFQKATGIKPIAESTGQEHDFLVES